MEVTRRQPDKTPATRDEFDLLRDEINRLFDFDYEGSGLFDRRVSPPIDVVEGNDDFVIICDLPGVKSKDLDISVANNVLTIKGEKKIDDGKNEKEGTKYYRRECWSGTFQRTLSLPESVDNNNVDASMKDGVLTITVGKREEVKPRKISVKVK